MDGTVSISMAHTTGATAILKNQKKRMTPTTSCQTADMSMKRISVGSGSIVVSMRTLFV